MLDHPGDPLKIHARPVPVLGGLAVIIGAWVASAVSGHPAGAGLSAAVAVVVAVGLVDSVRPLPAVARLAAQLAAGIILAATGPSLAMLGTFSGLGTVVLVVACANATNMIDGQDGLAAGLVILAAGGIVAGLGGAAPAGLLLAGAGALLSFLVWNRPPAKVFLGNGAPDGLAVILVAGVMSAGHTHGWPGLLSAATCLGVLLFELVFTFLRRARRGQLMAGDRLHSYDLLAAEGISRTRVTLGFWGAGAALDALAVALRSSSVAVALSLDCLVALAVAVWGRQLWLRRGRASGAACDPERRRSIQVEPRRIMARPARRPGAS